MASLCRRPGLFSAITVLLVSALIVTFGVVDIRLESGAHIGLGLPAVLHDLSFTVVPGKITAIVGPSGSGKSTIAKLMAGF